MRLLTQTLLRSVPVIIMLGIYVCYLIIKGGSLFIAGIYFTVLGFIAFKNSPLIWITLSLIILFTIPAEANIIFTGVSYVEASGKVNLHVITYFTFGGMLFWILSPHKRTILQISLFRRQVFVFSLMIFIEVVLELFRLRGGGGVSNQLPDVYLGPILYYFIISSVLTSREMQKYTLNIFLALATLVAGYGIVEFLLKFNYYFESFVRFQNIPWYLFVVKEGSKGHAYRIMTSLGHPLINGGYFLTAFIFMIYSVTKINRLGFTKITASVILMAALILTFSRGACVLASVGIVWFIASSSKPSKAMRFLMLLSITTSAYLVIQPLLGLLIGRDFLFQDTSASVRLNTIKGLFNNFGSLPLIGYGPKNLDEGVAVLVGSNSSNSLEIGYVIVMLQYGAIFLALYLYGVLISLIGRVTCRAHMRKLTLKPYSTPLIFLLIYFGASNTIGVRSTINYLFFLILALYSSKAIQWKSVKIGKEVLPSDRSVHINPYN